MLQNWHEQLEEMFEQMVQWRRHLHQHPELSFQEVETPRMIAGILESFGIGVQTNVGGRGVIGKINGGKPGKTIALRADFDALPIQDEKKVEYKSKVDGVMHACGHDGHTATLLAVAKVLSDHRRELAGNIVLIHQHAEELAPGGAIAMIKDGCLDGVDFVFGTHLASGAPLGTYLYKSGYGMAAADFFDLTIQGVGGHGASPHETVDALVIGAQIVSQLQNIVSRRIDPQKPVVLTVGSFHSGKANNVIPDTAQLTGTIRTFDKAVRAQVEEEVRTLVDGICTAYHAEYELKYTNGYPAVYNYEKETEVFVDVVKKTLSEDMLVESPAMMGSEDFAYYLLEKPGMFFHTGARNEEIGASYPHHHPKFDFDERAMVYAGKAMLSLVHRYLAENAENPVAEQIVFEMFRKE